MPFDNRTPLPDTPMPAERAFAYFDGLEAVDIDFMIGRWRGESFATDHAMDGVLERFGWYGKEFLDAENVHPLLFRQKPGGRIRALNPGLMPMETGLRFPALNNDVNGRVFRLIQPLLATGRSRARLRRVDFRGKLSAAMVYDQLPIIDVFRKVDDNTLLGVMDKKGRGYGQFFVLRREDA